jgi:hypothetical protein
MAVGTGVARRVDEILPSGMFFQPRDILRLVGTAPQPIGDFDRSVVNDAVGVILITQLQLQRCTSGRSGHQIVVGLAKPSRSRQIQHPALADRFGSLRAELDAVVYRAVASSRFDKLLEWATQGTIDLLTGFVLPTLFGFGVWEIRPLLSTRLANHLGHFLEALHPTRWPQVC